MQGDGFGKEGRMEGRPPRVSRGSGSKQGGEACARWAWAEPSVWTDRMLLAFLVTKLHLVTSFSEKLCFVFMLALGCHGSGPATAIIGAMARIA